MNIIRLYIEKLWPRRNTLGYINHLLYPILFETDPVVKAVEVSTLIKESKPGYTVKPAEFVKAINHYLWDDSILSKTIAPDYDKEKVREYLGEIKRQLSNPK